MSRARAGLDPDAIAERCLLYRTRRAARSMTRLYDDALRPTGMTSARFFLLGMLARSPGAKAGDLAEALDYEKSTLSRNLEALIAEGLVEVRAAGRSQPLFLTPAGRRAFDDAIPCWESAQEQAEQQLGALADVLWQRFPAPPRPGARDG